MNTVGKTLVILNFLFAIGVCAFFVVDFATRTSWKNEYDKLKSQLVVLQAERQQYGDEAYKERGNTKLQTMENDKQRDEMADREAKHTADLLQAEQKATDANIKTKNMEILLAKAVSDVKQGKMSEARLKEIVTEREKSILDLQESNKKYRTEAVANEALANQLQDRTKELLEQLQKVSVELAKQKAGASGAGSADGPRIEAHYNDANPPTTMVKGKIEKVDPKDSTLVQISVGTDQGVRTNNTMEVFRTSPAPKYLGMIRIVDASPHNAVGRLIVPAGISRPQLQAGDLVWSRLR